MNYLQKNKYNIFIFFFLVFGAFISLQRGSNFSDGDSHDVILSFLNFIDFGTYSPSRGAYGHLIPEFIIGFFAYYFGTPISNLVCFLFFFCSLYFISKSFNLKKNDIILFYILSSSNFLLLAENANSIDYPIALFFFSVGIFFLFKNKYLICSIFFGLTIISRANFIVFVYPVIIVYFFYRDFWRKNIFNFLIVTSLSTTIGLLFFIPTFVSNDYSLNFISIPFITETNTPGWYGGPEFSFKSLRLHWFSKNIT